MQNTEQNKLWNLYSTSEKGLEAMLEACGSAEESIDLEQFIFVTDEIGKRFIDVCARKATEGVKVRFLWDAAGSFSFFGSSIIEDLDNKKITLAFFKTLFPSIFNFHNYRSWYFRNHKRTLVVDKKIGFTGSICFSEQMINWRDTVVRIEGEVVNEMQLEFERTWNRALSKKTKKNKNVPEITGDFRYVTNYPLPRKHKLYKEIIKEIRNAKDYIYITTPYFIPTRHLSRIIKSTSKRGVNIKIIIPEWGDHPLVDLCSRSFFTGMLKSGVQIYLYKGKMMHSKSIIIDDAWCTVGTLNMDTVSLLYNFEANLISRNLDFTRELKDQFLIDQRETSEVLYNEWKNRGIIEKAFIFLMRSFRDFL